MTTPSATRAREGAPPKRTRDRVCELYDQGWKDAQIARELGIDRHTVKDHVDRIRRDRGQPREHRPRFLPRRRTST